MRIQEQNKLLDEAFHAFSEIKIGPRRRRTYAPFQKGWLMNIISLRGLYLDMKAELGIQYIIPSHLNQDHLENIFSQIRGLGGFNNNPTALEFRHRIKKLICSKALLVPESASVRSSALLWTAVFCVWDELFCSLPSGRDRLSSWYC
jgi:hypothetical protein